MRNILIFLLLVFAFSSAAFAGEGINIPMVRPANAPYFVGMQTVNIYADDFDTIILSISSNIKCTARLLWASSYDPQINMPKSIWFVIDKSDGFKEYIFNVRSQNPYWTGFIKQIVVYPEARIDGIKILSAKAIHGYLLTHIWSGWREFLGPSSRIILGSTVNNMKATQLWGKSINLYVYVLLLLIAAAFFVSSYIKSSNLSLSWQNCGKATIISAIAFYVLLDLSNLINQYSPMKDEWQKFGFKSLEEKRAILVGEDFYRFTNFCRNNIPPKAAVKVFTAGPLGDYPEKRLIYFLYPLDFFAKEADYIIVTEYNKDLRTTLNENQNFRLLKKFNEGAYILCRKKI